MSVNSIKERFNSAKNQISESLKTTAKTLTIVAGLLQTTGCDISKGNKASVDRIPVSQAQNRIAYILTGRFMGQCNFMRVHHDNAKSLFVTAHHCITNQDPPTRQEDIVATSDLFSTIQKLTKGDTQIITDPKGPNNKSTVKISSLPIESVPKTTVTIHSCYPDQNGHSCYKISGKPRYYEKDGILVLFLSQQDYQKIYQNNTDPRRTSLNGMSGSPVMDEQGHLLGVLSGISDTPSSILGKIHHQIALGSNYALIITPIRDQNNNLKIESH